MSLTFIARYKSTSPAPEMASARRASKRRRTKSLSTSEEPGVIPSTKESKDVIRCVCNSKVDNGSAYICCEKCSDWQHMNCMQLPWTTAEAAKQDYLCEKCAPAQHKGLLTMLKKGTWEPLSLKSVKVKSEEAEDEVGIDDDGGVQNKPKGRVTRATSRASSSIASPGDVSKPLLAPKLRRGSKANIAKGSESLNASIAEDTGKRGSVFTSQRRGAISEDNGKDVVNTEAAIRSRSANVNSNSFLTAAIDGQNQIVARNEQQEPRAPAFPFNAGGPAGPPFPQITPGAVLLDYHRMQYPSFPYPLSSYPPSGNVANAGDGNAAHEEEEEPALKTPPPPSMYPELE